MNKKIEQIWKSVKKIKIEYIIVIVAIVTVFLIFISGFSNNATKTTTTLSEVEEYVAMLEKKLCVHLSQIDGAGKVSVIISVKEGVETKVATETITTNGVSGEKYEESPILVSGKPIILNEVYPEICGVIIIAKGANNVKVRLSLMSAAQVFLDITSDKIEILTMR